MIFQDPMASFSPRMNILDSLCEGLRYRTNLSGKEREQRAYEVLEQVGLKKEYAHKYCYELSGGECQRAAIGLSLIHIYKLAQFQRREQRWQDLHYPETFIMEKDVWQN